MNTNSSYTWGEGLFGIILFLIVAGVFMGGNGIFGGGNANANLATNDFIASEFSNQNDKFVLNQLASQNTTLQSQIADARYDNLAGVKDLQGQIALGNQTLASNMSQCCCGIERSIDGVNYNMSQNTAAIIQNATANTQAILDKMCENEIQSLRDKVADYKDQINSTATGQYVLNQLGRYTPYNCTCTTSLY